MRTASPQVPIQTPAEYQRECGRRLRWLLDALGLTQPEAAEIMGITKQVLNHWLQGRHGISAYALYRLSLVKRTNFDFVFLAAHSRLPADLAARIEREYLAELADAPAPEQTDP